MDRVWNEMKGLCPLFPVSNQRKLTFTIYLIIVLHGVRYLQEIFAY